MHAHRVVGLSFFLSVILSLSQSVIIVYIQDFSQTTNADGTEHDMKDEDHGYADGLFLTFVMLG